MKISTVQTLKLFNSISYQNPKPLWSLADKKRPNDAQNFSSAHKNRKMPPIKSRRQASVRKRKVESWACFLKKNSASEMDSTRSQDVSRAAK